jgi:hypothetical protein
MKNKIYTWQNLTNEITADWIRDYFEIEEDKTFDFDWVGDDVGSIFNFADYWFNFSDVLDCYKHEISKEHLFRWYDYCLENQKINISLAKFILSPEEKIKREKEHLEQLKERVKYAKEELNKALKDYER